MKPSTSRSFEESTVQDLHFLPSLDLGLSCGVVFLQALARPRGRPMPSPLLVPRTSFCTESSLPSCPLHPAEPWPRSRCALLRLLDLWAQLPVFMLHQGKAGAGLHSGLSLRALTLLFLCPVLVSLSSCLARPWLCPLLQVAFWTPDWQVSLPLWER